jgi:redox-sensitive bicupin YhaK (pirin superfamily)
MLPQGHPSIAQRIVPRIRDLGDGFQVRRALPDAQRRSVGPFVFFDQMGPVVLRGGQALDVRPHPHIGLATVTYLFEGEILHRDSLGNVQPIRPGEVNWMTAGRGIVHSERTPPGLRGIESRLFGLQVWVALPEAHAEAEPAFAHHDRLPVFQENGVAVRLILGDLFGMSSPVATASPMFYADVSLTAGKGLAIPSDPDERGVYVVEGAIEIDDATFREGELLVFQMGADVRMRGAPGARIMVFGGPALDPPRYVWWNFVSSRKERIEQAAEDWRAGRFAPVPGETEFIPLPPRGPRWVDYP